MPTRSVVNLMTQSRVVCHLRAARSHGNIAVEEFASYSPVDLLPMRHHPVRTGSGALEGRWWFASAGQHVAFTPLVEWDLLMTIDFAGKVIEVQRDPLIMIAARSSKHALPRPWLYVCQADGTRMLVIRGAVEEAEHLGPADRKSLQHDATLESLRS